MNCTPSLVIGYGNPYRGDDGIGPEIGRLCLAAGRTAIEVHQLLPELAEEIARASRVIFVDCHAGLAPGEIAVMEVERRSFALHEPCSPATLIELARDVYGAAPAAYVIGVGPRSLEFGDALSEAVASAIPRIMETIDGLLKPLDDP
jgi:hydrogenase maturation protease